MNTRRSRAEFLDRWRTGVPLLLDGPTGTELESRGVDTTGPQWSAAALLRCPEVVRAIHADYVAAGAEVLTANTFRTHARNLAAINAADRAAELTTLAVRLAREAADDANRPVWVAGSQAPLADCYSPELTDDEPTLLREHRAMAEHLASAGANLILVETQPTLREALVATRAALGTGLPVVTCLVCNRDGQLLSGERLTDAAQAIGELPVLSIGVNCIVAESVANAIRELRNALPNLPLTVYANISEFVGNGVCATLLLQHRNGTPGSPAAG
ncbi:MAG: homocysteine S-methyltransferase family protein [Planctomycetaceae bacterium]